MNPKDREKILRSARQYIEKGWCQGCIARNRVGVKTYVDEPDATNFRLYGTILRALLDTKDHHHRPWSVMGNALAGMTFAAFNDAPGRTKEEVLAKVDEAISLAVSEG